MSGAKSPKRWLGLLLAVVLSDGIGHFYLGLRRRALVWFGVETALVLLLVVATVLFGGHVEAYAGAVVLSVLVKLGQLLDLAFLKRDRFKPTPLLWSAGFAFVTLGLSTGMALAIRAHLVEALKIPGSSMAPTLLADDHVVVDKTAFASRTARPASGQVIVFEYPDPDPDHPRVDFLKRVVGLPGDRIEFEDGHPIINGWRVPSCLVGTLPLPDAGLPHEGELHVEFLGDRSYLTFYEAGSGVDEERFYYRVRPGQMFVLGDNRSNSFDSRSWDGGRGAGVPAESIKGEVLSVWLAFDETGAIWWDRLGLDLAASPGIPGASSDVRAEIARCMANRPTKTLPPMIGRIPARRGMPDVGTDGQLFLAALVLAPLLPVVLALVALWRANVERPVRSDAAHQPGRQLWLAALEWLVILLCSCANGMLLGSVSWFMAALGHADWTLHGSHGHSATAAERAADLEVFQIAFGVGFVLTVPALLVVPFVIRQFHADRLARAQRQRPPAEGQ